jgi:hypothetical protein
MSLLSLGVDDLDARTAELAGTGLPAEEVDTKRPATLRVAGVPDPKGNCIIFGRDLIGHGG